MTNVYYSEFAKHGSATSGDANAHPLVLFCIVDYSYLSITIKRLLLILISIITTILYSNIIVFLRNLN